jgi:hypothetical protein
MNIVAVQALFGSVCHGDVTHFSLVGAAALP